MTWSSSSSKWERSKNTVRIVSSAHSEIIFPSEPKRFRLTMLKNTSQYFGKLLPFKYTPTAPFPKLFYDSHSKIQLLKLLGKKYSLALQNILDKKLLLLHTYLNSFIHRVVLKHITALSYIPCTHLLVRKHTTSK